MRRRFEKEALVHLLQTYQKVIAERTKTHIKGIVYGIIALIATGSIFSIPELALHLFHKENIKTAIHEYVNSLPLAISYDGVNFGAYRGVELLNLRISSEEDFSKEKVLLQAPVFRLRFDIQELVIHRKLKLLGIDIEKGTIEYRQEQSLVYDDFLHKIAQLVKKENSPEIVIVNSKFIYTSKRTQNGKFQWTFTNLDGKINSNEKSVNAEFAYSDPQWGSLQMKYNSSDCQNCRIGHGKYHVEFHDLNLNNTNGFWKNYLKRYKIQNANLNANADLEFLPGETQADDLQISVEANLNLEKAVIFKDEKPFIECKRASLKTLYNKSTNEENTQLNGTWENSKLKLSVSRKTKDLKYTKDKTLHLADLVFQLSSNPKDNISLPLGLMVQGLEKINFHIRRQEEKGNTHKYLIQSADISLPEGEIYSLNYLPFRILVKKAGLQAKDNQIQATATLLKNNSDVRLSWQGEVVPYEREIVTYYYPYGGFEKKAANRSIVAFQINGTGELNSKNLYWNDLSEFYDSLKQEWDTSAQIGYSQGWRASIVRERQWFNQAIQKTDTKLSIHIQNALYEKGKQNTLSLNGEAFLQNSIFQLSLADLDNQNKIQLRWNAQQNYPFISGEFQYVFFSDTPFARLWISKEIIESFESGNYHYSFTSSGERAVDLIKSHKGEGKFEFTQLTLNPSVKEFSNEQELPLHLTHLSGYVKRSGEKAWLYSIEGQNIMYTLQGRGTWSYIAQISLGTDTFSSSGNSSYCVWEFFPIVREKKPSEN